MNLENQIEAVLFYKNENVKISWLSKFFEKGNDEIEEAIKKLEELLQNRGLAIVRSDDEVALRVGKEASSIIEKISKDEMVKELTPSALETLSIIVYKGPIAKKDIDYIRGVNSGFTLRNLLIRGLIQKDENSKGNLYMPTVDLLSYLGITKIEELEEYESFKKETENLICGE